MLKPRIVIFHAPDAEYGAERAAEYFRDHGIEPILWDLSKGVPDLKTRWLDWRRPLSILVRSSGLWGGSLPPSVRKFLSQSRFTIELAADDPPEILGLDVLEPRPLSRRDLARTLERTRGMVAAAAGYGEGRMEIGINRWDENMLPQDVLPSPTPPPDEEVAEPIGEPSPRYADFTFYDERGCRVPDGHTLQKDKHYSLEVAVRKNPSGIPPESEFRRPLRDPKQRIAVTLWAVAESDDFEIEHPTQTILLPPAGDSTRHATFAVKPLRESSSAEDLGRIYLSIYYEFNLLERVEILAEVCGPFDDTGESRFGREKPIFFRQRKLRNYDEFESVRARSMSVQIDKVAGGYDFRFVFRSPAAKPDDEAAVVLPARARLQAADLEDKIAEVRRIWQEVALSDLFTTGLEGTKNSFAEQTSRLAKAGRNLWRSLFLQETEGSMAMVGDWLRDHAPERDAILQIHLDPEASDFVFPWTLLYDRELPENEYELVDLEGFWGVRYRIEQPLPGKIPLDRPARSAQPLQIGFMLWDQFRNAQDQIKLMQDLVAESGGKLAVSAPPVNNAKDCYALLKVGGNQILYFYSHGYTRARRDTAENGADVGRSFLEQYEKLDASDPLRESLKLIYDAISQVLNEPERSYIQLTYGKLYLDEMSEIRSLPGKPLVVLNMCESAQRSPLLSESFVHFFLDRGAAAVLGTECPMTVELAHPFAESFLSALLRGDEVGAALLKSRRKFLEMKNPLGLAYTLYGRDTLTYEPPCLEGHDTPQSS